MRNSMPAGSTQRQSLSEGKEKKIGIRADGKGNVAPAVVTNLSLTQVFHSEWKCFANIRLSWNDYQVIHSQHLRGLDEVLSGMSVPVNDCHVSWCLEGD